MLVLAGTAALGGSSEVQSPVLERARSLQPGSIGEDRGDRYRIDERRNVVAELEHAPITGLGMNVPWSARYPLSEEHDRNYTHVVLLWYWLKMGLIGVLAFIWLYGVAMWTAFGVWRNHPNEMVRLGALAALGGLVALVIVELTASFTGVEPRLTIVFGGAARLDRGRLASAAARSDRACHRLDRVAARDQLAALAAEPRPLAAQHGDELGGERLGRARPPGRSRAPARPTGPPPQTGSPPPAARRRAPRRT